MYDDLSDLALEVLAEAIEDFGTRVIATVVADLGERDAMDTGGLGYFSQGHDTLFAKFLVRDEFFESETNHLNES